MSRIVSICSCWVRTQAGRASPLNASIRASREDVNDGVPSGSPSPVFIICWEAISPERNLMQRCRLASGTGFPLLDPAVVLLQPCHSHHCLHFPEWETSCWDKAGWRDPLPGCC